MNALVAGGTGLVGGFLLRELAEDTAYARVISVGRRPPAFAHPKLQPLIADLGSLPALPTAEVAFCCLGTTRARAGGAEAFRRVDLDGVEAFARGALAAGARTFLLVSSSGADAASPFLYPRTKGEAEAAVARLGFRSVVVLRPSLLLGRRAESRPLEAVAQALLGPLRGLFVGPLRRYAPIEAAVVARAVVRLARAATPGLTIVENDSLL